MKPTIHHPKRNLSETSAPPPRRRFSFAHVTLLLLAFVMLLFGTAQSRADSVPPGCTGSGLGILLFTDAPDVHVGDTLRYSVTVFNGTGNGPVVCDATGIQAWVVTPDGVTNVIALRRTTLTSGQSDFYSNVVSYVVRAQDIRPDGTVRATANDTGVIHQNDTDSVGGGFQGVNTEVSLPCIQIAAQCVGSVGENGAITFTGTVTNCGNNTLVGVTVSNFVNGGQFPVTFITNLARGQSASFSGSWVPANPCSPSTATLVAQGTDQFTTRPRTVTSAVDTTCSVSLTPGIKVTKTCPAGPTAPGQLLTFSGSVSNTGNVTLTNIVVVNDRPSANTVVFTTPSLAPGAVMNFTGSYLAPTNCSVTDTLVATANSRCGAPVSSTASATCAITTTPGIRVTEFCPVTPAVSGGQSSYSGVVSNSGNITLNNVTVVSDRPAPNTVVFTGTLAPGASANYSGTFTVPMNVCTVTTAVRATGNDSCTGAAVTNTASITCPVTTAPAIAVTLACPTTQSTNGGLITYTGTVRNSGNVTLNNIVVTNSQSSPSTVFTVASLAPGASVNFTASFTAPLNVCSVTSTVGASGTDNCSSVVVSSSASATCTLATNPRIIVTQICSGNPTSPGGTLTYSGTVSNAGNIALTNIVVTNDRTGATPVYTASVLVPGASSNFTGSYTVPADTDCSITSTLTARGNDNCSGISVTNVASATCSISGTPLIAVTLNCPTTPVVTGSPITYNGTVRNSGNVTLINVTVVNNQASPSTVFSVASLAPGASANFSATFTSPANACSVTSTVTARGSNTCAGVAATATASATCTLVTSPALVVRQNCSPTPATAGGVITYTGSISNAGNITLTNVALLSDLVPFTTSGSSMTFGTINTVSGGTVDRFLAGNNLNGLSYADEDKGYAATQFYSLRRENSGTSSFLTINANGTVTSRFDAGSRNFDALTFAAPDVGYGPVNFYYLRHDNAGVSSFGTIKPGGATGVVADLFVAGTNFNALTFAATDVGFGANLFYYLRRDASGRSTFGTINPALPGTVTDRFIVGTNFDALVFASTDVGYGVNLFYYLRHDASGRSTFGTISAAGTVTDRFVVGTNLNELTFTATDVGFGANLFYFMRGGDNSTSSNSAPAFTAQSLAPGAFSGTVRNSGNVTLNNVTVVNNQASPSTVLTLATLAPGASANFTASFATPVDSCSVSSTVVARGNDACTSSSVSNSASATCALVTTPRIGVGQSCPTLVGGVLSYTGSVTNLGNVTLTNVIVRNDRSGSAVVFTARTLAPGARTNFTGSYSSVADACSVVSTITATGADKCTGSNVVATASANCPLPTAPRIVVTQTCPTTQVTPGERLTYSGTVSNAGNSTLVNVVVTSDRTGATPVLTVASLAPRATANFTGSYVTHDDCCVDSSTVTATGRDCNNIVVRDSATRTCTLLTRPAITVTRVCSTDTWRTFGPGDVMTYSGVVSNSGNIALTNVTIVANTPTNGTRIFGPVTLAAGEFANYTASFVIPADFCGTDTVTARGFDVCTQLPVTSSATSTCPITTTPRIAVTKNCPSEPTPYGGTFTFTGTVSNPGNVTLTNVYVVNNQPAPNTPVIGPITLAPGASRNFSGSYPAPTDCCEVTDTLSARGQDRCSGTLVSATATEVCPLLTTPRIAVVEHCPTEPVPVGGFYEFTGSVTNTGDIVLTNVYVVANQPSANTVVLGPIELAPGESEGFYGSFTVVAGSGGLIVRATGQDTCQARTAAASANCAGPITDPGDTNAFHPVAGTFNGLFFDANDVQAGNSGFFSLKMTDAGTYTVTIRNAGKKYTARGTFDGNGAAANTIPRAGRSPLTIHWQASLTDQDYLGGSVNDGNAVAQLAGGRAVFNAGNPAPQAGRYTLSIPGIVGATESPDGNGFATVVVDAIGVVHLKGRLADGSALVQTVALASEGEYPLYVSLYNGRGVVLGWLQFADDGTNDVAGRVRWIKGNLPATRLYPAGFNVNSDVIGSRYAAPAGTESVLRITDGIVGLSGGNLPDSSNEVTFGPDSVLVNNGPNTLKMKFTPETGLFSGTFKEAGSATTFAIKGVVLQRQNNGSGYAPGANQSGRVFFQPAP